MGIQWARIKGSASQMPARHTTVRSGIVEIANFQQTQELQSHGL